MARFSDTPPTDPLPRAETGLPQQAVSPEGFALPEVTAEPPSDVPVGEGPPEGLPAIPVVERPEHFPESFPEDAEDALFNLPWL